MIRLVPFLLITSRISLEPRKQLSLRYNRLLKDECRVIRIKELMFSEVLEPPAEQTHMRAMRDRRCHLQTLMGINAIERLFVTLSAKQQALFHPMT
jgi:hypothetical protein